MNMNNDQYSIFSSQVSVKNEILTATEMKLFGIKAKNVNGSDGL
ncbi:MAG: hypothetical protein ACX932_03085 [Gammaproteobacteria bacterium]